MKRDHEQQEGTKRKVLKLDEGQDGDLSSGSDTEEAGRRKKDRDKEKSGQDVDIQVSAVYRGNGVGPKQQTKTLL